MRKDELLMKWNAFLNQFSPPMKESLFPQRKAMRIHLFSDSGDVVGAEGVVVDLWSSHTWVVCVDNLLFDLVPPSRYYCKTTNYSLFDYSNRPWPFCSHSRDDPPKLPPSPIDGCCCLTV